MNYFRCSLNGVINGRMPRHYPHITTDTNGLIYIPDIHVKYIKVQNFSKLLDWLLGQEKITFSYNTGLQHVEFDAYIVRGFINAESAHGEVYVKVIGGPKIGIRR